MACESYLSPLPPILQTHHTLRFSVMLCSSANLATTTAADPNKAAIFFYVIGGADILSLVGSRMLFHLKAEGEERHRGKRNSSERHFIQEGSEIRFADGVELDTWAGRQSFTQRSK